MNAVKKTAVAAAPLAAVSSGRPLVVVVVATSAVIFPPPQCLAVTCREQQEQQVEAGHITRHLCARGEINRCRLRTDKRAGNKRAASEHSTQQVSGAGRASVFR